jgi:hypothetical protein
MLNSPSSFVRLSLPDGTKHFSAIRQRASTIYDVRPRMLVLLSQADIDPALKKNVLQEAAALHGNLVAAAPLR